MHWSIVFSYQLEWEPNSLTAVNAGDVGSRRLAKDMPQGPGRAHPPTDFLEPWSFAPPFNSICDSLPSSMLRSLKGIKNSPSSTPSRTSLHIPKEDYKIPFLPLPLYIPVLTFFFLLPDEDVTDGELVHILPSRLPYVSQMRFLVNFPSKNVRGVTCHWNNLSQQLSLVF